MFYGRCKYHRLLRKNATSRSIPLVILYLELAGLLVVLSCGLAAAGGEIRKLEGRRLTLFTDVSGAEIDSLPSVFDQAFEQFCRYFGVDPQKHARWHMCGCLMSEKQAFAAAGLLPDDLPPFAHGYSRGDRLWLYEQPTDYYRRHLLLHEGVHGFMEAILGGCGPPWYMEGVAEYLATHRWQDGRLLLGYMPQSRDETPGWGRIRIIQDAVAERRALRFPAVIDLLPTAHRETEAYAWSWAAATLLDRHPCYHTRFRSLINFVAQRDFNHQFQRLFQNDWQELCEEWQLFIVGMEYGYDIERCAVDFTPGKLFLPTTAEAGKKIVVAADRGWQNSGLKLQGGREYRFRARGRFQVAETNKPWLSEAGGVSIRYYQGHPLGVLLAAVRPDNPPPQSTSALLRPVVIGLSARFTPSETGTLFFKINDSAGELHDNAGTVEVEVW